MPSSLLKNFALVTKLLRSGKAVSCYTPGFGGVAEAVLKMALGNRIGFRFAKSELRTLFGYHYGAFLLELAEEENVGILLGETVKEEALSMGWETLSLEELQEI